MKKRIISIILFFPIFNFLLAYVSTPLVLYLLRTVLYTTIGIILFYKFNNVNPKDCGFFVLIGIFMIILILLPLIPFFPRAMTYILINQVQNLAGIILGICLSNLKFNK